MSTHIHEHSISPLTRAETGDMSDEDGGMVEDSLESQKASKSADSARSFSPNQLSARVNALHLSDSPSSTNGRSASAGREGYGFRPSGTNTPLGIEGVHVQPGTAAVVDKNGLGWPGMSIPYLPSLAHLDPLMIEQPIMHKWHNTFFNPMHFHAQRNLLSVD